MEIQDLAIKLDHICTEANSLSIRQTHINLKDLVSNLSGYGIDMDNDITVWCASSKEDGSDPSFILVKDDFILGTLYSISGTWEWFGDTYDVAERIIVGI